MGIAEGMKNLAEDIAASYDVRVKAFGQLITDTHEALDRFSKEHEEMAEALKADLARGESERFKGFKALLKSIQQRQKEREREVADLLKRFQKEQKEMAAALEDALARGESVRKEDFQKMLKDIQSRQKEREREADDLLKGFREEQERMASEWQKLTATMEGKRSGRIRVPKVEVREEEVAVEEVPEEEAVARAEAIEVTPEVAELQRRVFEYLADHPDGTRMVVLEREFGIARIQMARILKNLISDNKVEKRNLLYFAI